MSTIVFVIDGDVHNRDLSKPFVTGKPLHGNLSKSSPTNNIHKQFSINYQLFELQHQTARSGAYISDILMYLRSSSTGAECFFYCYIFNYFNFI